MITEKQILKVQGERWARLRKFHNFTTIDQRTRHFFMANEIKMLRDGKKKLEKIREININ